jgi:hypothetical protein
MERPTDLFGNPVAVPKAPTAEEREYVSIKERVLSFLQDNKYESYTQKELSQVEKLANIKPQSLKRAIDQLMKSRKIKCTGEMRGPGIENTCLRFNSRREK